MKPADLCTVTLIGLLIGTISARAEQHAENVEKRVDSILSQMTLREKLNYIGGTGFYDIKPIPRFGLPQIFMVNGPLGIQGLEPSTRYPAGLALAASWNRDRARGRGRQLGLDARARGRYVILGPGVNIYR